MDITKPSLAPGETATLDEVAAEVASPANVVDIEPDDVDDVDTCEWIEPGTGVECDADGTLFEVIELPHGIRYQGMRYDDRRVLACSQHVAGFFGEPDGRWAVKVHQEAIATPGPRR